MSGVWSILFVVGSIVLGSFLVVALNHRRLRKRRMLLAATRVTACVFVQLAAILVVLEHVIDFGQGDQPGDSGGGQGSALDIRFLITLMVVVADVAVTVFLALYQSEMVEPQVD